MCGRYNLHDPPEFWLPRGTQWLLDDWRPRYNIAPGQVAPVIDEHEGARRALWMWWGLVPHWLKEENPRTRPINARAETAAKKPFFRDAMAHRRCVVPASGFYEWQASESGKQPFLIERPGQPLYFAGIWDQWRHAPDGPRATFAILTTDANTRMAEVHQRMPVLLDARALDAWLQQGDPGLLGPWPGGDLRFTPISRRVNNPQHDAPDILTPETSG